jgi:hypothetical protein
MELENFRIQRNGNKGSSTPFIEPGSPTPVIGILVEPIGIEPTTS